MPSSRSIPRRRKIDQAATHYASSFCDAVVAGDRDGAERVAQTALADGLTLAEVHALVIEPAMDRIGDLWEAGSLTIGDEHLGTAISQAVVASIYPAGLQATPGSGSTILFAAIEGERHELGLRMAADLLEGRGHTVHLLGADVPLESILAAVKRFTPDLVGLSVTTPFNAPILIADLIALIPYDIRVIVGGGSIPTSVRECGVLCVESVLDLPETIESVPGPSVWKDSLSQHVRNAAPSAAPRPAPIEVSALETALAETATEVGELARAAMRESYLYERLASIDPLTMLPNRRAWDEHLADAVDCGAYCVAMVDIDRFSEINAKLGHAGGDRALCQVADVLSRAVRGGDFVARFGGDEFAVLLGAASVAEGARVAERLRRDAALELDDEITLSIGVALVETDARAGTLAADRALYEAKSTGRNRVVA